MTVAHLQRWTCDLGGCGASVVVAVDVIVSDPRPPSGWGRHVLRWEGDERTLHFCPRCEEQSRGWGREPERGEYLALSHSLSRIHPSDDPMHPYCKPRVPWPGEGLKRT